MDERLSLKDVAAELGVQASTLRHQIKNGRLRTVGRDKRGHLIDRAELDRYRSESLGKPGARDAAAGGRARAAKLTPERRREIAVMGGEAYRRKYLLHPTR